MRLRIDKKLNYDQDKLRLASEFVIFCVDHLPIEGDCNIYVVADRDSHGITTTAVYQMGKNVCKIYGKNRAFVDVLRSIAHEMTHMMQDEMGLLTGHIRDAGGFHEDQANAKAGELIKLFAKSKKDRKAIYENKDVVRIYEDVESLGVTDHQSGRKLVSSDYDVPGGVPLPGKFEKYVKDGADVSDLTPSVIEIIKSIFQVYDSQYKKDYPNKPPKITSGFRGPAKQAQVMFNNWETHGGKSGGNKYLIDLYANDKLAKKIGDSFTKTGDYKEATKILSKEPVSAHGAGRAIDLRSRERPYMSELLNTVKKSFPKMKINDETKYKNPHWHISVRK